MYEEPVDENEYGLVQDERQALYENKDIDCYNDQAFDQDYDGVDQEALTEKEYLNGKNGMADD